MKPHRFLMYTLLPLLAIGGYIAADLLVAPVKTDAPMTYRLLAQEDCNLSNRCVLQHEALVIRLSGEYPEQSDQGLRLNLESSEPLKGAAIALGNREEVGLPANMQSLQGDQQWSITLLEKQPRGILRLLLSTQDTNYFAELHVTL